MKLIDKQSDGSFGKFFGHPEGETHSKKYVTRMLEEFGFTFDYFENLILSTSVQKFEYVTALQHQFFKAFKQKGWKDQPSYPESKYKADYGFEQDGRWIFVEVELSDIRRAVNAFYMSRVFKTGYMRLGIFIIPESKSPENKPFYSSIIKRYKYLSPDYPLWIIGFGYP